MIIMSKSALQIQESAYLLRNLKISLISFSGQLTPKKQKETVLDWGFQLSNRSSNDITAKFLLRVRRDKEPNLLLFCPKMCYNLSVRMVITKMHILEEKK